MQKRRLGGNNTIINQPQLTPIKLGAELSKPEEGTAFILNMLNQKKNSYQKHQSKNTQTTTIVSQNQTASNWKD